MPVRIILRSAPFGKSTCGPCAILLLSLSIVLSIGLMYVFEAPVYAFIVIADSDFFDGITVSVFDV